MKNTRDIALVTGASSGIGTAIAKELAQRGYDLIITARRKNLLLSLSQEITNAHAVSVHTIEADIATPSGIKKIIAYTDAHCVDGIDVLVNNAGFGDHGIFYESSLETQLSMIDLNIKALTHLSRTYLPKMKERDKGFILNVGSVAGFQPGPYMAVYYASKAYVLSLSEALSEELQRQSSRVSVTVLCPGPTQSEFGKRAFYKDDTSSQEETTVKMFKNPRKLPTSEEVARYGISALFRKKRIAVHGFPFSVLYHFNRILPRNIITRIIAKLQEVRAQKH